MPVSKGIHHGKNQEFHKMRTIRGRSSRNEGFIILYSQCLPTVFLTPAAIAPYELCCILLPPVVDSSLSKQLAALQFVTSQHSIYFVFFLGSPSSNVQIYFRVKNNDKTLKRLHFEHTFKSINFWPKNTPFIPLGAK